jgi:hypothetical protein
MVCQIIGTSYLVERDGRTPVVWLGRETCYWQEGGYEGALNAWEYWFERVGPYSVEDLGLTEAQAAMLTVAQLRKRLPDVPVDDEYRWEAVGAAGVPRTTLPTQFMRMLDLAPRYVRLKPTVLARADALWDALAGGRRCVGLHYRGTNKFVEATPLPFEAYWRAADAELAADPGTRLLVATDAAAFWNEAQRRYGGAAAAQPGVARSDGPQGTYLYTGPRVTEQGLLDTVLLSRCDRIYHGVSNVYAGAAVLNPELERVNLADCW